MSGALRSFAEATTDYGRLLDVIASTVTGAVADACIVRLLADGWLTPVAFHLPIGGQPDPHAAARVSAFLATRQRVADYAWGDEMIRSGEPFVIPHIEMKSFRAAVTPEVADAYEVIGVHSLLVVVLRLRGESIGTLSLFRFRDGSPPFDDSDRTMAQALADHAALAIANARSYDAQRASEASYRLIFDNSPLPKWVYEVGTLRIIDVNIAAIQAYGYTRSELLEMTAADLHPPADVPAFLNAESTAEPGPKSGICTLRKKCGELIQVEITRHSFVLGEHECRIAVGRDITERLRLEEQLRQSQKMDAIGRLAGGVAHDFNNLLSVILSYAEMLISDMEPSSPILPDLEEIQRAGKRASELTRQLLTFSRRQVLAPRVLDLNAVLTSMSKMLERILGADVELVALTAESLGRVRVDPTSIEQVIMNLVVNARDAMPVGGKLTLETANVVLDETYARDHLGAQSGPHVMLAVTDTGVGMDKATQARVFEPFFTTKGANKGTGLGLSTVFGIVNQSGGSIWVYSEVGVGTTFKVYFPCVDEAVDAGDPSIAPATLRDEEGSATILLVEDDDQVRAVAREILEKRGYVIIEARNAGEALLLSESHAGPIDLLLSDVVMPQMSGPELAKRLAVNWPDVRVLCMSGYTDESIVRHGVMDANIAFLQKPITAETLARRVREVLSPEQSEVRLPVPAQTSGS